MWFWYVILAAAISSFSVLINKALLKKVSAAILTWSLFALSLPLLAILSFSFGKTDIKPFFFVGTLGSGLLFMIAKTIDLRSIKHNLLSKIYPLSVFSTLFAYFLGLVFLGERIKSLHLLGGIFILFGAYWLNVERAKESLFEPILILLKERTSFLYIIAMFLVAFSTVFDKIGVINTKPTNPYLTLLIENFISTIFLTFYVYKLDRKWTQELKNNFFPLLLCSFVYVFIGIFILSAFAIGPIALVSSIKKIEILLVLFWGSIFLGDKPVKHIWIGTLIMVTGVILIKIG